jgi:hypothetical protein
MDGQRSLTRDGGRRPGMNRRSTAAREAGAAALGDNEDRTISLLTAPSPLKVSLRLRASRWRGHWLRGAGRRAVAEGTPVGGRSSGCLTGEVQAEIASCTEPAASSDVFHGVLAFGQPEDRMIRRDLAQLLI